MFCFKCGQQIPDESVFCPKCGRRVSGGTSNNVSGGSSATTAAVANNAANNAVSGGSGVLFERSMWTKVTALTTPTGKFTLTDSAIVFKSLFVGGSVTIPYSNIASAARTTYMMINPNALQIITRDGKKFTFLPGLSGKADVETALSIILAHI